MQTSENPDPNDDISFPALAPMAELGCWTMVALAPLLRWVNGPAVSTDQFVVQVTLVTIAFVGGVGLRIYNWKRRQQ